MLVQMNDKNTNVDAVTHDDIQKFILNNSFIINQ